jgi:hypothetical protein
MMSLVLPSSSNPSCSSNDSSCMSDGFSCDASLIMENESLNKKIDCLTKDLSK